MKAYLITPDGGEIIDFDGSLEEAYELIECTCIDIVRRKIGSKYFNIVVDDEGLFRCDPLPSAINADTHEVMLVGNILIAGDGSDLCSLTDRDISLIERNVMRAGMGTGNLFTVVQMRY